MQSGLAWPIGCCLQRRDVMDAGKRSHKNPRRLRREVGRGITFETVDVTGGGKLHGRLAETSADVVFAQEHHWPRERLGEECAKLRKAGWVAGLAPACQSPLPLTGTNGGVGIATASGPALTSVKALTEDIDWPP